MGARKLPVWRAEVLLTGDRGSLPLELKLDEV